MKKERKPTAHQRARAEAMPHVRALIKRYGRSVIAGCLARLREFEREQAELEAAEKRVASLRRKIGAEGK